jgi:hypothetical protein
MKKYFFFAAMLFCAGASAQIKYSVYAGAAYSSVAGTGRVVYFEGPPVYSGKAGLTIGGAMSMRLYKKFWYEAGLAYCGKGDSYILPVLPDFGGTTSRRFHYLIVNQDVLFRAVEENKFSLSAGAGVWGGVALAGYYKSERYTIAGPRKTEGAIKFGDSTSSAYCRRMDAGVNALLRVQYGHLQLTGRFSPSLVDYNKYERVRFRTGAVTVGYTF